MIVMTWSMKRDETGRPALKAGWTPAGVPAAREAQENLEVPVLRAS
jgi:hypothetical protein